MKIKTGICLALLAVASGSLVYAFEPYIEVSEVRATGALETIRASWGLACGEEFISLAGSEDRKGHLRLVTPESGKPLEESIAAVPDNEFVITGYRYKTVRRNRLSGRIEELPSPRFDVLKWRVVTPYRVRLGGADTRKVSAPLGWSSDERNPKFSSRRQTGTGSC